MSSHTFFTVSTTEKSPGRRNSRCLQEEVRHVIKRTSSDVSGEDLEAAGGPSSSTDLSGNPNNTVNPHVTPFVVPEECDGEKHRA